MHEGACEGLQELAMVDTATAVKEEVQVTIREVVVLHIGSEPGPSQLHQHRLQVHPKEVDARSVSLEDIGVPDDCPRFVRSCSPFSVPVSAGVPVRAGAAAHLAAC